MDRLLTYHIWRTSQAAGDSDSVQIDCCDGDMDLGSALLQTIAMHDASTLLYFYVSLIGAAQHCSSVLWSFMRWQGRFVAIVLPCMNGMLLWVQVIFELMIMPSFYVMLVQIEILPRATKTRSLHLPRMHPL